MSSLVGGTGIIGQDMVYGFRNGKYKQFEGTEISIENCLKAKVKDLVVEGKTYQNLAILKKEYIKQYGSNGISTTIFPETNSINITTTFIDNGVSGFLFNSQYYLFKSSTQYTLECDVDFGDTTITNALLKEIPSSTTHGILKSGHNKIIFTTLGDLNYLAIGYTSRTVGDVVRIDNIKILEGDYTDTDIPTSINGIESVGEREGNVLSVKINDNTTTLNLPIPLRSLHNGVADTIEGNKLVQRVGKVVLDGIDNIVTKHMHTNSLYLCVVHTNYTFNNDTSVSNLVVDGFIPVNSKNIMIPVATENSSYTGINKRNGNNYGIFIRVPISFTSTADEFNTYLQQNPMTVYYPLADPVIHSLEIPQLATTKGTNVITTTNNIKPKLSMKVKVK